MFSKNSYHRMIRGKNIIGTGARRVVYDLGNGFVLKLAKSDDGIKSNRKEVILYKSSPPELKKHLAPVVKYGKGYRWIIMKKYDRPYRNTTINMQKLSIMKAKFRKKRIIPYETLGVHGPYYQNIRLKPDGEVVVIDYGNFMYK